MPNWKKVITSGSDAALNSLLVTNGITGSLLGTASTASFVTGSNVYGPYGSNSVISSSYALTSSYAKNITISGSINNVDYIDFNTGSAVPTWKSGRVFWDNTEQSLAVYNSEADVTLNVGQENWTRVWNASGVTISNGKPVRISGTHGDVPQVVLAQSVAVSGSANLVNQVLGLATHDIEVNTFGFITTQGLIHGLNTSAYNDGDTLYISTASGLLVNTQPSAPYEIIPVGQVVKASPGTSGIIYCTVQQPIDFSDLSSVRRTGIDYAVGDIWTYVTSGSTTVWVHGKQLSGSYGITGSINATSFTGSLLGTASYATQALSSSYALTASYVQNAITASYVLNAISASYALTASNTPNALITASVSLNTITFTKGNGSTFPITVNTGSGGAAFPYTGSALITGSLGITGSLSVTSSNSLTLGQFVGNNNGYVEFSVRNNSTGISASGDIAVYADNGTTTNNYIDMGINNSGLDPSYFYGGTDFGNALDAYLYNVGGNLRIGNATSQAPYSQSFYLFSNPSATPDIAITGSKVGIGKISPNAKLDVSGSAIVSGSLTVTGATTSNSVTAVDMVATNGISIQQPAGSYYPTLSFYNNGGSSQGSIFGYNSKLNISSTRIIPGSTLSVNFSYFDANYAQLEVLAKSALSSDNAFGVINSAVTGYHLKVNNAGNVQTGVGGLSIPRTDTPNGTLLGTLTHQTNGVIRIDKSIEITGIYGLSGYDNSQVGLALGYYANALRCYGGASNTGFTFNTITATTGTYFARFQNGATDLLTILTGGNTGISNSAPSYKLDVSGSARISGAGNTSISSSLVVYGSGSTQPVFTVQGSQGELFSITDSLSGSLFSVNDISGLPIMEVFSDNTTLMGSYQAPSLNTTVKTTTVTGSNIIYLIPTSSYNGAWFEYVATSASNARAGQIMSVCSSNTIAYTETTTTDIGSTTGLAFRVMITGSNFALTGSSTTAGWTIKTIVRSI